ncbi:MAG: hypothetical protein GY950_11450 [bacterium]|nr:hypothetical protein [bacterium]
MSKIKEQKPLCFVIMPFDHKYDETYDIVKSAGKIAGFHTERADETYTPGKIPDRIQNFLDSASVLVAEISENNPNVYYELGHAHASKKPVVLIRKKDTKIPFDIQHWNQIPYEDLSDMGSELAKVLRNLKKNLKPPAKPSKKLLPKDLEVGQLALKCGMISPSLLEKRLEELNSGNCPYDSLSQLLLAMGDIDKVKEEVLSQAQKWVGEYFDSVSRSLNENVWIKQLHRQVKLITWRDKARGDSPIETRQIKILDKTVDVYDEAIFSDHIFFQKFNEGMFNASSTGIVMLHEMKTDFYKCFIPENSLKYYKKSDGHSLAYFISINEDTSFPLLVSRSFTYVNGFQADETEDNREAGIGIREANIEQLILEVDFELLPFDVNDVTAELRKPDKTEPLEIKQASQNCYYVTLSYPPKRSAVYIKWHWDQ